MDLPHGCVPRNDGRNDRGLERPGRRDHIGRLDRPLRGFGAKTRPARGAGDLQDLGPAADGRADPFGIGDEIIGHPVLAGKSIGGDVGEVHARKAVMPGRAIGHQRIPAFRSPAFGNAVPFKNKVRDPVAAQMLAHRDSGLPGAHDQHLGPFDCHTSSPCLAMAGPVLPA